MPLNVVFIFFSFFFFVLVGFDSEQQADELG